MNVYFISGLGADERVFQRLTFPNSFTVHHLKWAINEILNWQNRIRPENITHIHGTADKLFPFKLTKADISIKDGGHLMVYVNAEVMSDIISEQLGAVEYAVAVNN